MGNQFGKKMSLVSLRKPAGEFAVWNSALDARGFSYGLLVLALALACVWGSTPACAADNAWLCTIDKGDWNDETNWSQGRVPDRSDNVIIDCPGEVTVTLQGARADVRSVMNANTLVDQGDLMTDTHIQNDGTLVLFGFIWGAPIRNNGNFIWLGGTVRTTGDMINTGTLTISGGGAFMAGYQLINDGTIVHTEGGLSISAPGLRNNGVYEFQSGAMGGIGDFDLSSTGILYKSGADMATINNRFNNTGGAIAVLEGTLVLAGSGGRAHDTTYSVAEGSSLIYRVSPVFTGTHSGVIEGTLRLEASTGGADAVFNFLGTGLQWVRGRLLFSNLRNDGLITILSPDEHFADGNELVNAGTIAVDAGALLRVGGNYTQTAEGTLAVTLGGSDPSQFGRATIAGEARLAGDLAPALEPDYRPSPGSEFAILHYGRLATMFDTCSGCDLGGGLALDPVYTPDELKLVAIQP